MTNKEVPQYYLECLKKDVETKVGRSINTYSDFNYLFLELKKEIADAPSVSTLKRLWAYVSDNSSRSKNTLNSLSRYLGYPDWTSYLEHLMRQHRVESGFLDAKTVVSSALVKGDMIEIGWNPGRELKAEYLGDNKFRVISALNSKLTPGMTFTSLMFSKGLPLTCSDVEFEGQNLGEYACGTKTGLTSLKFYPS